VLFFRELFRLLLVGLFRYGDWFCVVEEFLEVGFSSSFLALKLVFILLFLLKKWLLEMLLLLEMVLDEFELVLPEGFKLTIEARLLMIGMLDWVA
jgi:hypothetical protein